MTMYRDGISQSGSLFANGTSYTSQWPIPLGTCFDCEFNFGDTIDGTLYTPLGIHKVNMIDSCIIHTWARET